MNEFNCRKTLSFLMLLLVFSAVICSGCPRKEQQQPRRSGNRDGSGGTNEQVFEQSINSIYHLENHFGPDSLMQILRRLEGWMANQSQDPNWKPDPFFAEQEKKLTELSGNCERFAAMIERIAGGNDNPETTPATAQTALTPNDVQEASTLGKMLIDQLAQARSELGLRALVEYEQRIREIAGGILTPLASTAVSRNLSETEIRGVFQNQFQQLDGNTMQIVGYFREMSGVLKQYAETFRGETLNFRRLDGDYLKQAFWCKNISQWAGGNRQDEMERAKALFDWTVRNVMMQSSTRGMQGETVMMSPQAPWEALLFGSGTTSDWAYIFIELLRQQRIDACLFTADIQNSQGQVESSPWAVGVLVDGKVHIFLVRYGLPLVEESEVRLEPGSGLAFGKVVTYDQLQEKPEILAAMLGEDYPVEQVRNLLNQTKVMLPANPIAHSQSMLIMEKALIGNNKAVLFGTFEETKNRFEQALPGQTISQWPYPLEANFQNCLMRGALDMRMELFKLRVDANHPYPLWKGRILFLAGRRTGLDAATSELQHACVSDHVLAGLMDQQAQAMTEPMKQLMVQMQETEAALQDAADSDKAVLQSQLNEIQQAIGQMQSGMADNFQGLQFQAVMFGIAVGAANYWLGQAALEEAFDTTNARSRKDSLKAAYDYVAKRVVNNPKAQQWQHGAYYHLGRVCEAQENYDEAMKHYSMPSQESDRVGRLYRAKQLQRLAPQSP